MIICCLLHPYPNETLPILAVFSHPHVGHQVKVSLCSKDLSTTSVVTVASPQGNFWVYSFLNLDVIHSCDHPVCFCEVVAGQAVQIKANASDTWGNLVIKGVTPLTAISDSTTTIHYTTIRFVYLRHSCRVTNLNLLKIHLLPPHLRLHY